MRCFWDDRRRAQNLYRGDPISHFRLGTNDNRSIGFAAAALPTLVLMEGGHAVEASGANVAEFLGDF